MTLSFILFILTFGTIFVYMFVNMKEEKKKQLLSYEVRRNVLVSFLFIIALFVVYLFFILKNEEEKIRLGTNDTYIKKFYTGLSNAVKVYVRPLKGQCTCVLLYGSDKDDKIIQCKWISKSDDPQTNSFINDALGSNYELRIVPSEETSVYVSIGKMNNASVYHTPYNAIVAPLNSLHTRTEEIVSKGSTYSVNQKSQIFDFGVSNATNIEIVSSCSSSTTPRMNLFGSDVNEYNKFVRIAEFVFGDGFFDTLNSLHYINQTVLTHHRFFYIQVTNATASNFYVKITRRNY